MNPLLQWLQFLVELSTLYYIQYSSKMVKIRIALIISSLLILISLVSSLNNKTKEKSYSFECGFNPFNRPHTPFSIQFFKILLIFLIFDIEIIVVLPLPLNKIILATINYFITRILIILILGLLFEWKEGSLQWLKLVKNLINRIILIE